MIRGIDAIMISTENAKDLASFYEKKVGLKLVQEFEGEEGEEGYAFEIKGAPGLFINSHSKVKGKSKESPRIMINFEVGDEEKEVARLKKAGVKVVQDIYHIEGYGFVATFEDPDGNFFQFVQVRAAN